MYKKVAKAFSCTFVLGSFASSAMVILTAIIMGPVQPFNFFGLFIVSRVTPVFESVSLIKETQVFEFSAV